VADFLKNIPQEKQRSFSLEGKPHGKIAPLFQFIKVLLPLFSVIFMGTGHGAANIATIPPQFKEGQYSPHDIIVVLAGKEKK
jgi:hypothetical protein